LDDLSEKKHLQESAARLRTLNRLNRFVSSTLDYEHVLEAIARAAADIMETPCVSFWSVDPATRTTRIAAWSDPMFGRDFPTRPRVLGEGAIGRIVATVQPLHIPDVYAAGSLVTSRDWWQRVQLTSFYGLPVLVDGEVHAVLCLNGRAPFAFGVDDQELLESFVAQAAIAIRNARLFAQSEERRRAAETAEARYRTLFDHNLTGILRTAPDGRILECNEALARVLGYSRREELMAINVKDLYVDIAERAPIAEARRDGKRATNVKFRWRRADGGVVTLVGNVTAVDDPQHGPVLDGILVDVSDRERLDGAEREAEALRAVARLAHAAAHEINNPLAVVTGHLAMLERRYAKDPDAAARVEKAQAACKRIAEKVAQLGKITRLELQTPSPDLPPILDLEKSSERDPLSP
jgi:PAS domain S-box-containing protein